MHLDTARIGRLCPASLEALQSFGRLLAAHGRVPHFPSVVREGFHALPEGLQREFQDLRFWNGLQDFQSLVSRMVADSASAFVIFSAQSTALMVFAAHVLAHRARRILCTDLEFPLLQRAIKNIQEQHGGTLEVLPLRRSIEEDGCDADEITQQVIAAYLQRECGAIVLSQVTQEGVRMPCEAIVKKLRMLDASAFIMIDGAQGLEQESACALARQSDLYFAVTHKWLEGSTLGLTIAAREASLGLIKATLADLVETYVVTDPYLRLIAYISGLCSGQMYETISLEHLFVSAAACRIAIARAIDEKAMRYQTFKDFVRELESMASAAGCLYRRRHSSLRSGIAVIDWPQPVAGGIAELEQSLESLGVVVTALSERSVRVSAPTSSFGEEDWRALEHALSALKHI